MGYSIFVKGLDSSEKEFGLLTYKPWDMPSGPIPLKIVDSDLNSQDEGCDPAKFAAAGPFNNTVVLVDQGTVCYDSDQATNALNNGALGIIMFVEPKLSIVYETPTLNGIQFAVMRRQDGLALKAAIAKGSNVSVDFSRQELISVPDSEYGGLVNDFSSITPFWDMTGGPSVSAVGGNVLSAWPLNLGEFAIESGSSMSTPAVSGVAALYMSAHKDEGTVDPLRLREILSSTATPVKINSDKPEEAALLDTVVKQGGGLLNAYKAIHHTTEVSPGMVFLNDTAHANLEHTITITNVGKEVQTYQLSQDTAGALMTLSPDTNFWRSFPIPYDGAGGLVNSSSNTLTLNPGVTGNVQVVFTPPAGVDAGQVPVYSGFLKVVSNTDQNFGSVNIPYFGVAADMANLGSLAIEPDPSIGVAYPYLGDAFGAPVLNDSTTYTLKTSDDGTTDAPTVVLRLRLGSARMSVDLIKADTSYKPSIAINDPKGSQTQRRDFSRKHRREAHSDVHSPHLRAVKRGAGTFDDVDVVGNLASGRAVRSTAGATRTFQLHSTVTGGKDGRTVIPVQDGQYRFLVRVLKLFRDDFTDDSNYESYLSHAFTISGASNSSAPP